MDITQIYVKHIRSWTLFELGCFITLICIVTAISLLLVQRKKIQKHQAIACLLGFIFLGIVIGSTVFTRTPMSRRSYKLQLFWSWIAVVQDHSYERLVENLLNIVLLMPFGFLLPIMYNKRVRLVKALVIGIIISSVIEISQLVFYRGMFEFDDIVHNSVGCMLGCLIMSLLFRIKIKYKK